MIRRTDEEAYHANQKQRANHWRKAKILEGPYPGMAEKRLQSGRIRQTPQSRLPSPDLLEKQIKIEPTKPVNLVPVQLQPAPPNIPLTLSLQNDRFKIEIGTGFSDELLGRLIVTLESL